MRIVKSTSCGVVIEIRMKKSQAMLGSYLNSVNFFSTKDRRHIIITCICSLSYIILLHNKLPDEVFYYRILIDNVLF